GLPVICLHGGPGTGSEASFRRYFDPEKYRIIVFDQRGSGRSEPHASIENNTTQKLLEDIEAIREHFKIDKWMLLGGSWGSTLALVYAETYPDRVSGLILRGVFLGRQQDLDWLYKDGLNRIFPDYWQQFIQPLEKEERTHLIKAFYQKLTGEDELARMGAAKAWCRFEAKSSTLNPNSDVLSHLVSPHLALGKALISTHYFLNNCFIEKNQILNNAKKLIEIPGIIVHGRYDVICPLENAWTLQQEWENCELHVVRDAGHSAHEAGIIDALVKATKEMHQLITNDCSDTAGF
ncbi:MAG: prolyl aminopeptidase, partial [Gammaproteobacteria bacterium]|nr:prolyl aminopeptidase [Gammaproteobacteria bacterium]